MLTRKGARSDILVFWPNSDGSWTISHRTAATTVMPTLVGTANKDSLTDSSGSVRVVASLSSKSQTDSPAVVTFVRPLQMPATYKGKGEYYQLKKAINQVRSESLLLHAARLTSSMPSSSSK